MTREEAEIYARNMSYEDALFNLTQARAIPYRKATFIKVNELIQALSQEPTEKAMTVDEMEREYEKSKALFHKIVECDDAISRDAVCEIISDIRDCISVEGYWAILERLKKLPSVTQKSGECNICKWYDEDRIYNPNCENCCRNYEDNYCEARMVEPQERSEEYE